MSPDTFGLSLPGVGLWLPLVVGMFAGGFCILMFRALSRPSRALAAVPAPTKKKEHDYDPFVQGSPTEQRKAHRRGGNPVEVFLAAQDSSDPLWRGWVVDRSVGGVCLCVPEEFLEGTIIRMLPTNAPSITPWTDLEVRSCRATSDGHEIGCQFVRQPPWAVLLLFG